VYSAVKPVGKPDAGNRHVRFDERGEETEPWQGLRHRHLAKAVGTSYSLLPKRHRVFSRLYQSSLSHWKASPDLNHTASRHAITHHNAIRSEVAACYSGSERREVEPQN
jgi:hypothetical protein